MQSGAMPFTTIAFRRSQRRSHPEHGAPLRTGAAPHAGYGLQEEHDVAAHPAQELEVVRAAPDSPLEQNPNSENCFFTRRLLQPGQMTVDESSAFATSSSKAFPHFRHSYSYIGIAFPSPIDPSFYENA